MVYNSMYPIRQTPYFTKDNRNLVKKKEDEESSKSAYSAENNQQEHQINPNKSKTKDIKEQFQESKEAHQKAIVSRDAHLKNATVNIAQIIKDFKNTASAIGTPDQLMEEVQGYLSLIETQVKKDEPNTKIVKTNLKNAALILDGYITETLQRPSQVVENWLDALFLQQVDYKFNEEKVNPQFLVKFPEGRTLDNTQNAEEKVPVEAQKTETISQPTLAKSNVTVPSDTELKSLFLQAKKYTYSKEPQKALATFKQALERANSVKDSDTKSKILYEIGKIYDKNDYLAQALNSYFEALKETKDNNVKVKAHYSMAQIYDDVAEFKPAIEHYMSSISFAGEVENFTAQATSLSKIGNIYTDKYDKKAFDFFSEAKLIAAEGKDDKVKGYVSSTTADAYATFKQPQEALMSYAEAAKDYQDANNPLKIIENYRKAARLMTDYKNTEKAKSLLKKSLVFAQRTNDVDLMKDIAKEIQTLQFV